MQKVYIVRDDEKFYQSYNIFENHIEAKRERVCTGVLNELSACKLKIHTFLSIPNTSNQASNWFL